MTRRKSFIPNKSRKKERFTVGDIVRAIESVEATGLEVLSVEITPSGTIKIATGPRQKRVADAPPSKTE
jgi:hypothetical protein